MKKALIPAFLLEGGAMTIHTPLLLLRATLAGGLIVGALAASSSAPARAVVGTRGLM